MNDATTVPHDAQPRYGLALNRSARPDICRLVRTYSGAGGRMICQSTDAPIVRRLGRMRGGTSTLAAAAICLCPARIPSIK